jgi:UDP-N-acetylmuramoyl-L-alanyl-D-glutamate--2,6-diaminopimelate ligase
VASSAPPFSADDIVRGATSLTADSRTVRDGAIFVALRGTRADGHDYIDSAIERGARTVVMESARELPSGVRGVVVPDSARALASLADAFYGAPAASLTMVGITGTNGKTTTTQMVAAILSAGGVPAGIIGTLGASFSNYRRSLQNTTPLANELHAVLAQLRDRGARAVVLEVSSHALALDRVAGVRFAVGALTNVTRDHLDFHGTFESYATAKRALFDACDRAVFNLDDDCGAAWAKEFDPARALTYSLRGNADVVACDVSLGSQGSRFFVDGQRFEIPLAGRFNIANALAAIATARLLNVSGAAAAEGLMTLENLSGRMERLSAGDVEVFIDYAHTPDALAGALQALRELRPARLTVVFGCGGDRDRGKRPQMGAIAAELADRIIVTSDNPRSEDPAQIASEIAAGIGAKDFELLLDRRAAIERAIDDAAAHDVVLVAGKGHENYQVVGDAVLPFDDRTVAAAALAHRATKASDDADVR